MNIINKRVRINALFTTCDDEQQCMRGEEKAVGILESISDSQPASSALSLTSYWLAQHIACESICVCHYGYSSVLRDERTLNKAKILLQCFGLSDMRGGVKEESRLPPQIVRAWNMRIRPISDTSLCVVMFYFICFPMFLMHQHKFKWPG